jgi:hypothetical protein
MKVVSCALVSALSLVASAAVAQTAAPISPTPAAATMVVGAAEPAMLRTGTKVPLKTNEFLTTKGKKLKSGQRVNLEVTEAVLVNGQVVVPAGAPALGEITSVKNKGMWGKSGKFEGQLLHVTVAGRQIRLTGKFDDKGTAGGVGAVATSVLLVPIAGFFMTGTSAKMEIGTPVIGFIGEDIPVAFAASAGPEPLVVPAAAPATAAPAVIKAASPAK